MSPLGSYLWVLWGYSFCYYELTNKTKGAFYSIFGVDFNFHINLKIFQWTFENIWFGNDELQLFVAAGYSLWSWIWIWIWATVMSQSLGNQSDARVTKSSQCDMGKCGLNQLLKLNKYYKLDAIGNCGNIFSSFQWHFSVRILLPWQNKKLMTHGLMIQEVTEWVHIKWAYRLWALLSYGNFMR